MTLLVDILLELCDMYNIYDTVGVYAFKLIVN